MFVLVTEQVRHLVPAPLKQVRHGRWVRRLAKLLLGDGVVHELKDVLKLGRYSR